MTTVMPLNSRLQLLPATSVNILWYMQGHTYMLYIWCILIHYHVQFKSCSKGSLLTLKPIPKCCKHFMMQMEMEMNFALFFAFFNVMKPNK